MLMRAETRDLVLNTITDEENRIEFDERSSTDTVQMLNDDIGAYSFNPEVYTYQNSTLAKRRTERSQGALMHLLSDVGQS